MPYSSKVEQCTHNAKGIGSSPIEATNGGDDNGSPFDLQSKRLGSIPTYSTNTCLAQRKSVCITNKMSVVRIHQWVHKL